MAKAELGLPQQHTDQGKQVAEGQGGQAPDTCSLEQGGQASCFKDRSKVWSGAPWRHHSLFTSGLGAGGETFFFLRSGYPRGQVGPGNTGNAGQ